MTGTDVKLLGASLSPFVLRSRIALNMKSVSYEFLQETMGAKSELLLKSNPVYKKIPVLIHGDKPISESLIIVQYIDEMWTSDPSILPSDAYDRAIARFWAKTDDEKATAIEGVITGLGLLEEVFQKSSKGKAFFGGEHIGYLDIALGSYLGWLKVSEQLYGTTFLDPTKIPGLVWWAEEFSAYYAVKDVMPETDKFLEYAKAKFHRFRGGAAK